ncbi:MULTISPECIES: alpha-hydroxy acid oxidase [unclassified Endozoicomonas]|uniref:alpha-hydroxy acid oxidase n=1 Tax=unclassified Endozoicomonas TaxID=2644528 RepID=UPI003BB1DBF6
MRLKHCHNTRDFRELARRRLPSPIFHYIDGAADDETTRRRNTEAYSNCDLVPNVLRGAEHVDLSTRVMGLDLDIPLFLSPTALQCLFHHEGEMAVGKAAEQFGTLFGLSSLGTTSIEEIASTIKTPKLFQLYVHKDKGLTRNMIDRCKAANFDAMALTVDTAVGGNRERDLVTGFTIPPKLTLKSLLSFTCHPAWGLNYLSHGGFELPQLQDYVGEGTSITLSIGSYINTMLDQSMDWQAAEEIVRYWEKPLVLKGIMSVEDARRAVDIGAAAIMISNHGGRQLDGSRSPFDQLAEIVDAVGDRIDVICDGGIQRGTHVLKALSMGARACSGGRLYLYALAAAGRAGVEKALGNLCSEMERDMKLMGCKSISELNRSNLRFRPEFAYHSR